MGPCLTREDLPQQQQRLLDVILDEVGQVFEHSPDNIEAIRAGLGTGMPELRSHMQSLTLKGFLRREVRRGSPRLWHVSAKGGATLAAERRPAAPQVAY